MIFNLKEKAESNLGSVFLLSKPKTLCGQRVNVESGHRA
jgi:hypothetical protein